MNIFATFSYGCAALAFLMLTALLVTSWRGRRQGVFVIGASAATAIWAGILAASNYLGSLPGSIVYYAEIVRSLAWILALASVAGPAAPRWLRIGVVVVGVVLLAGPFVAPYFIGLGLLPDDPTLLLARSGLLLSLLGLVLLEQIYRNSGPADRHALKYVVFGVGVLLAYDVFLYSQAELLRGIMLDAWSVRGVLNACAVPVLAISARRNPGWSLDVFVSRQMVFYTSTFIAVGVYLTVMGIGGFYVRQVGGEWGRVGQIIFMAGSLVLLVSLTASATLRRQTRVFISKHFYRNKYDYRIEWLRFVDTLSSSEDDVKRTSVRAIAQILSSPGGMLFIMEDSQRRLVPAAAWPFSIDELTGVEALPADSELVTFVKRTQWVVDLEEYRRVPDMYQNVVLPKWFAELPELRVVSPLRQLDKLVGLVMLFDPPPPFDLTYEDRDLLKTVGRHVATHIAQHDADRKLAEGRQFEAYNRLTAFMMHDLKNSVAQLKLIVANAARHKNNPAFIDDAIHTIANAVERMTRLIEQLRGTPDVSRNARLDVAAIVQEAVERTRDRVPAPRVSVHGSGLEIVADGERLVSVLEHVIRNAQDSVGGANGEVSVSLQQREAEAEIAIADTGAGMDARFVRERLFRPFDSTKGSKGMGIGAYQAREYVRALGGDVEVQSSPGRGTRFLIRLPLAPAQRPQDRDAATRENETGESVNVSS